MNWMLIAFCLWNCPPAQTSEAQDCDQRRVGAHILVADSLKRVIACSEKRRLDGCDEEKATALRMTEVARQVADECPVK